ncbi:MAG: plasmid recombination protein [Ruthenibacterium sp.]
MASVAKFTEHAVRNQLRHNMREIAHSANADIDAQRRDQNKVLSPDRGESDFDYFKERKSELYCYGRDDVKVMAGWVVTMPKDLAQEQKDDFFNATYAFLSQRYGEKNVVQAVVHDDESGQAHLHFCFIPVVEDQKHEQDEKICANDVLNRKELRSFHGDLQRYLNENGIEAHVHSGITQEQGGSRTVAQMKDERERKVSHQLIF